MKPIPEPFTQATQLRHAREAHKLAQHDLAAMLGVTRQHINLMESSVAPIQRRTGLHAAVLFAWLDQSDTKAAPATPARRQASNVGHAFTTAIEPYKRISRVEVEAMAPGARYRMCTLRGSTLSSWNVMVRGPGASDDDITARAEPELSDQAWLDNAAKRFE